MTRQTLAAIITSALFAVAPAAAQETETWFPSLVTETPQEGFDLAVSMARRTVKTTQPGVETLMEPRPNYAHDAQSLIDVSGVVASWFATVAAANDYWRE